MTDEKKSHDHQHHHSCGCHCAPEESVNEPCACDNQAELEKLRKQLDDNEQKILRLYADMENARKRSQQEVINAHKFALSEFIKSLLPIVDSLEKTLAAAPENNATAIIQGTQLTLKMLLDELTRAGVTIVNPINAPFNPEVHEAMALQPSDQAAANTVLQVLQKGYLLNGRLVRPALVIVAK